VFQDEWVSTSPRQRLGRAVSLPRDPQPSPAASASCDRRTRPRAPRATQPPGTRSLPRCTGRRSICRGASVADGSRRPRPTSPRPFFPGSRPTALARPRRKCSGGATVRGTVATSRERPATDPAPPYRRLSPPRPITGDNPFHPGRFQVLRTLFSKFFATFPRGTCSLSVSRRYLALDGIYHPFCAALPSNATLRGGPRIGELPTRWAHSGLSPSVATTSMGTPPGPHRKPLHKLQFGRAALGRAGRFQV